MIVPQEARANRQSLVTVYMNKSVLSVDCLQQLFDMKLQFLASKDKTKLISKLWKAVKCQ